MKNGRNILITGGVGFIGSNLAIKLYNEGHNIIIIDNMSTANQDTLQLLPKDIKIILLDLGDKNNEKQIENILSQIDICYHLAAAIGVKLIQENPSSTLHNSLNINNLLFPLFEKYQTRVIYSSTSEVYGETEKMTGSSEEDNLSIMPSHKPRGSYACSKLLSEFLIRSYTFPSTIVRFFNVVGRGQVSTYGHVLPKFIECAKQNQNIPVYGNGYQIRSFCDIRDAIEMLSLIKEDKFINELYNIGNDSNRSTINELAELVKNILNSESNIIHIPFDKAFSTTFEEIYIRYPDTTKIKKYYTCKYSLKDIINSLKD